MVRTVAIHPLLLEPPLVPDLLEPPLPVPDLLEPPLVPDLLEPPLPVPDLVEPPLYDGECMRGSVDCRSSHQTSSHFYHSGPHCSDRNQELQHKQVLR